ncbi:MAG: phosphatase domain-containing protein, partial [Mycobacteriales bacterium]
MAGIGQPQSVPVIWQSWPVAVVVLDIDGVLADVRHRLRHLDGRRKNWDAFFAAAPADPPLAEGLALATELAANHEVVYLTGRPERCQDDTRSWLRDHGLPPGRLLMRPDTDRRPARLLKLELLATLGAPI